MPGISLCTSVKLGCAPAKVADCSAAHGFNPEGYCCFLEKERRSWAWMGAWEMNLSFKKVFVSQKQVSRMYNQYFNLPISGFIDAQVNLDLNQFGVGLYLCQLSTHQGPIRAGIRNCLDQLE
jgi:hypothetical protein